VKFAISRIVAANGRWLRVVSAKKNDAVFVITAFFDRKAEERR
jgi:hypothetical protein